MHIDSIVTARSEFVAIDPRTGAIIARNCPLSKARTIAARMSYALDICRAADSAAR